MTNVSLTSKQRKRQKKSVDNSFL
uniref:Uncharacterized protein n=1 Tax=Medicago truncatula TaxID=3880 RepID=I3T5W2_MEDTR|nr:unknown [Medicago truncatula]